MSVIIHPRPSPIAAAMYMLRDLDVDVIILHGPSGCCFGPARLLEKDGVKVFTTALSENELIFGGEKRLRNILKKINELFKPKLIGVVGTCASMIIGENIKRVVEELNLANKTICCNVHSGLGDNTIGAIEVLKEAMNLGIISKEEFERQKYMLEMATLLEKTRGTARLEYIPNSPGDNPKKVAYEIINDIRNNKEVACILNAKKETAFLFADIIIVLNEIKKKIGGKIKFIANLDPNIGLPRIRNYSKIILEELNRRGINIDFITGGLDEYPIAGEKAKEIVLNSSTELAIIAGIPHAVAIEGKVKTIAITSGSRATSNLKSLGYDYVVNEYGAHRVTLGKKYIHRSILGNAIRKIMRDIS
ncbi:MAG: Ni-sirohydrochlorin a,c-diamide reductive cyclase catalytic subunit [Candidatus Verstraetearchaeota archaeon]|jgi:putative methanogenesis marker 13 metalloprotein|nr:Ni-sirohydrochlorin a,c-diamide reductive cyclase catalytic subunit [Candidatus Verstraetearchaeota archaeon]